jgi:hypothetical protein
LIYTVIHLIGKFNLLKVFVGFSMVILLDSDYYWNIVKNLLAKLLLSYFETCKMRKELLDGPGFSSL